MNSRGPRAAAVRFMRVTHSNTNSRRARNANFTDVIVRANVCNHRLSFFSGAAVGNNAAATEYDALDPLNDHRRHRDKWNGGRIDIFIWRTGLQRCTIFIWQEERRGRNVRAWAWVGRFLNDRVPIRL